jgi:hypothetical protein
MKERVMHFQYDGIIPASLTNCITGGKAMGNKKGAYLIRLRTLVGMPTLQPSSSRKYSR